MSVIALLQHLRRFPAVQRSLRKIGIKGVNFLRAGCTRDHRRIIWGQTCPLGHTAELTADCFEAGDLLKFSIGHSDAAQNPLTSQQSIEVDVL